MRGLGTGNLTPAHTALPRHPSRLACFLRDSTVLGELTSPYGRAQPSASNVKDPCYWHRQETTDQRRAHGGGASLFRGLLPEPQPLPVVPAPI